MNITSFPAPSLHCHVIQVVLSLKALTNILSLTGTQFKPFQPNFNPTATQFQPNFKPRTSS